MASDGNDDQHEVSIAAGFDVDLMAKIQSLTSCESQQYLVQVGKDHSQTEARFLPLDYTKGFLKTGTDSQGNLRTLQGITTASWPLFVHWLYIGKLPQPDSDLVTTQTLELYQQLADFADTEDVPGLLSAVEDAIVEITKREEFKYCNMTVPGLLNISSTISTLLHHLARNTRHAAYSDDIVDRMKELMKVRTAIARQDEKGDFDEYSLGDYEKLYPGICQAILSDILDSWRIFQTRETVQSVERKLAQANKKRHIGQ